MNTSVPLLAQHTRTETSLCQSWRATVTSCCDRTRAAVIGQGSIGEMVNNSSRPSETSNKQERPFPPSQPPKFFSFSNGKAVPIHKTHLFKGKTFHLRCDFPDAYQAQLIKDIEVRSSQSSENAKGAKI